MDGSWGNNGWDGSTNQWVLGTTQGPLQNISAGISAASSGDVLVVAAGFYQETNWNPGAKSLTIIPTGSVTIYETDPWQTDSDGDGMSDGWELAFDLNPTNGADAAEASALPWAAGLSNLDVYQLGIDPRLTNVPLPGVTIHYSTPPNAAGWWNTNVTVWASATNAVYVTPSGSVAFSTETNAVELAFTAINAAGEATTEWAIINIDQTPPVITGSPADGDVEHNDRAPIVVQYSDELSGVAVESLQVILDSVDISTNFQRFAGGAIYIPQTNASLGVHSLSVLLMDVAGNSITAEATYTNAAPTGSPSISDLNLADAITIMPDVPEIWVQGKRREDNITVSASVNFGPAIALNTRGGDFGYLLPLDYGTNVIVFESSNPMKEAKIVVRSDAYRAQITAPAFGEFANGRELTVSGMVSAKYAEGTAEELGLAGVSVNGVAVGLGAADENGNVGFTTPEAVNSGTACAGTILPLVMELCWTNVNGELVFPGAVAALAACPQVPLGLLEGYEILEHKVTSVAVGSGGQWWGGWPPYGLGFNKWLGWPDSGPCEGQYLAYGVTWTNNFEYVATNCQVVTREDWLHVDPYGGGEQCVSEPLESSLQWYTAPGPPVEVETNTVEGVGVSREAQWVQVTYREDAWDCLVDFPGVTNLVHGVTWRRYDDTSRVVKFVVPFYYAPDTTVIFTLEGVSVSGGLNLTNLELNIHGAVMLQSTPIGVTNQDVSYLVQFPLTGTNAVYTIDASSFPQFAGLTPTPVISTNVNSTPCALITSNQSVKSLSFSGFHNADPTIKKLQYQVGSDFVDVPDVLYVRKGAAIVFKAIPIEESGAQIIEWQQRPPTWGGEASGVPNQTKPVTFNSASTSLADFKTVNATKNKTVTAKIIVYEFEVDDEPGGHFNFSRDNFAGLARSLGRTKYDVRHRVRQSVGAGVLGLPVQGASVTVTEVIPSATLVWGTHNYVAALGNINFSPNHPNIMTPAILGATGPDGVPIHDDDSHNWQMIALPLNVGASAVLSQSINIDGFDGTQDYVAKITLQITIEAKKGASVARPANITYEWTQTQISGQTRSIVKRTRKGEAAVTIVDQIIP